MREIAIVGAGDLGGAIAHTLARRNAADAVRLIDAHGRVAEGKALDINQAAPVEGFATTLSGSTDLLAAGGADLVVVADQFGGGEWRGDEGLRMVTRIAAIAPSAAIVCASAASSELIGRVVSESHVDRRRVFGTAPEALVAAAHALVALAVDASPGDVALTILGHPPSRSVILWDEATVGGLALKGLMNDPTRRRLAAQLAALWPPGPHALSAVVVKAVDAVAGRTRSTMICFVAPDDSEGRRARTAALPVRFNTRGIETVVVPPLNVVDRVALDNAMLL
jgi:malate dehydrogenase